MVKKQFYIGFMLALSVLRIYGRENTAVLLKIITKVSANFPSDPCLGLVVS